MVACGDREDLLQFVRMWPFLREGHMRTNCNRESCRGSASQTDFQNSGQIQEAFISTSVPSSIIETVLNDTAMMGLCSEHTNGGGIMKKRSLVWFGLILSLLLPLVTACAGGLPQKGGNSNP